MTPVWLFFPPISGAIWRVLMCSGHQVYELRATDAAWREELRINVYTAITNHILLIQRQSPCGYFYACSKARVWSGWLFHYTTRQCSISRV